MEASARKVQAERNRNGCRQSGARTLDAADRRAAGDGRVPRRRRRDRADDPARRAAATVGRRGRSDGHARQGEGGQEEDDGQEEDEQAQGPDQGPAARRARTAVAEVRRQGFTTLKPSDYDPKATLRVLIGRPVGDAAGGNRAFFFIKDALPRQRRAARRARS